MVATILLLTFSLVAAQSDSCQPKYKDQASCDADSKCTWCKAGAVPSSCFEKVNAAKLPPGVFVCDSELVEVALTEPTLPADIPEYTSRVFLESATPGPGANITGTGMLVQFSDGSSYSQLQVTIPTSGGLPFTTDVTSFSDNTTGFKYGFQSINGKLSCNVTAADTNENPTSITYIGQTFIATALSHVWLATLPSGKKSALFQNIYTNEDTAFILDVGAANQTSIEFTEFVPKADQRYYGVPEVLKPLCGLAKSNEAVLGQQDHHKAQHLAHCMHGHRRHFG